MRIILKLFLRIKHQPYLKLDSKLTDRFVTADASRTNQSVGLGLDIVRSLVTTLGGKFSVNSEDDQYVAVLTFRYKELQS